MSLPLPRVVADVGPGGPLVTSMRGINALASDMLGNQIKNVQAQYAPLTIPAQAMSQMAYANMVGPQYVAKLMANPNILANMNNPSDVVNLLQQIGMSGTQNNALGQIGNLPQQDQGMFSQFQGPLSQLLRNVFSGGQAQQAQPQQMPQQGNSLAMQPGLSPQDRQGINSLQPGQSYVIQGQGNDSGYNYNPNGTNRVATPQEINAAGKGSDAFFEQSGRKGGIVEEGKELGRQRAKAIGDLDEQYQQAVQAEVPVQHLIEMSQDPIFKNMRDKVPFFQDKQLSALAKIGTPEEQRIVGDFITTTQNAVANTINSFRGRILDKEITMANQMKISPNDTWNVMIGKLGSIATFNEMTKQRSRIASRLMQDQHLNRGDAIEKADKMVDGKKIRNDIEEKLNSGSMITIRNKKTGETITVPMNEARKKYGVQ